MRQWGPFLVLLGLLWVFSSLLFSSDATGRVFFPALEKLFPTIPAAELRHLHFWIRKLGHVCVYFVLSLVLLRALRHDRPGWEFSTGLWVIGLVAVIAFLDELHQFFVPGRGASVKDMVLDSAAAALAQLFAWRRARRQSRLLEGRRSTETAD